MISTRIQIVVRGIVQGVGFRPFVFSEARRHALKGRVLNNTTGVLIDVEGESKAIEQLIAAIESNPPPLSVVESVERSLSLTPVNYRDFRIVESTWDGENLVPISADLATCDECLAELFDPGNRRHRFPFINCTNCGPRFTIIEDVPYDRSRTSMSEFEMCDDCRAEYEDPLDRRFHAEPTACFVCGPRLVLTSMGERELIRDPVTGEAAINHAIQALMDGKIVAIKGVGGFHLACDATNAGAVERLRQRKYREAKPFALMAGTITLIARYCALSHAEEELLHSPRRPIVLLDRRPDCDIPAAVAPGVSTLGFMLPYTPLHYLLLEGLERPLVMTSGNVSDEPICYDDEDALRRLNQIADYCLLHNRRICVRADDSVTRVFSGREMLLRRSRGYAPAPIKTSFNCRRDILACGAELKNTFCLTHGNYAFLSHHIGDLENLETLSSFTNGIEHFSRLFNVDPEIIAYDLHPEYLSTKYAVSLDDSLPKVGVQHHHAHIASCMADNRIDGDVIGVAMDGLGFGSDGRLWGGEFFVGNFVEVSRIAHLAYVPMPGGVKAIREPWRMAAVYLHRAMGSDFLNLDLPFVQELKPRPWTTIQRMAATGANSPGTSSMGRLFDAIAALVRVRDLANYEGQAAIELETMADKDCEQGYEFTTSAGGSEIMAEPVISHAVEDLLAGVSTGVVSAKFHNGVANLISSVAHRARAEYSINRVALSGGVFQNMFLLRAATRLLTLDGFEVFTHRRVPPNDGGISLGQAAIANAQMASGRI